MAFILRANQIYSQPGKPGRLPTGKSHFYEEIEPRLERVVLGTKAVGYTERSLDNLIEEGIGEAERDRRLRVNADNAPSKPPQPKRSPEQPPRRTPADVERDHPTADNETAPSRVTAGSRQNRGEKNA